MIATYRRAYQLRLAYRHHWPAPRREKQPEPEESEPEAPYATIGMMRYSL